MKATSCLVACGLLAAASSAWGEVREMSAGAFSIETVVTTRAPPDAVFRALGDVPAWWDPEHTWSGSAENLSLVTEAGGCFCEKLGGGGSIQHGRVIYAQPGVMLRLDAPLGPLQEMAVSGVLSFALAPDAGGTRITMTYRVAGAFTMETAKLAPLVDQVMSVQLQRLKAHGDAMSSDN